MIQIRELLTDITNRDLVLPEFQREYVWGTENAKKLMVSLFKEYPVGSVLFWKTTTPPELKNYPDAPQRAGAMKVLLDGQQRLTTLYLLTKNQIPPYYTKEELVNDPRDLCFNLEDGDFQYYHPSIAQNPLWLRVTTCFLEAPSVFRIAHQIATSELEVSTLAERYNENLSKLRHILDIQLPVQVVPQHASINAAIEIFDNVNSEGTRLTSAELALTHVTGRWSKARQVMKQRVDELKKRHFIFGLDFLTRALTTVVTGRADFTQIYHRERNETIEGWDRLNTILDYLVSLLPIHGHIHTTNDLTTANLLIPLIAYLNNNEGRFPNQQNRQHALQWLYRAMIWARYSSQTDQRLETDVKIMAAQSNPWENLYQELEKARGNTRVTSRDLNMYRSNNPFYPMVFILAKANGAVDWFTGAPLASPQVTKTDTVSIFSRSLLEKHGYLTGNHQDYLNARGIANRVFLSPGNNFIQSRLPEDFFPEIQQNYPHALDAQFIPSDPELWRVENFVDFVEARRALMALRINEYIDQLTQNYVETEPVDVVALIRNGESDYIEFKASFGWNTKSGQRDDAMIHEVLKAIAAFLNADGGTLLIGVNDDGSIHGLEKDLQSNNLDLFERQLKNDAIKARIGGLYLLFIRTQFEVVDGKRICAVFVEKSSQAAFVGDTKNANKKFYARLGNASHELSGTEMATYIRNRWGG